MTSRRQQRARQAKRPASGSSRPAEVAFFKVKVFLLIIVRKKKVAGGAEHGQPGTAERALLEEERMRVGAENVSKNQGLPSALSI